MKALFKYILYSTFFAMSLPLVTACDDDEATDPYDINYVYIYKPSETNATLEYKGDGRDSLQPSPCGVFLRGRLYGRDNGS